MVSLILGLQRYTIETKIKKKFKKIFFADFGAVVYLSKANKNLLRLL